MKDQVKTQKIYQWGSPQERGSLFPLLLFRPPWTQRDQEPFPCADSAWQAFHTSIFSSSPKSCWGMGLLAGVGTCSVTQMSQVKQNWWKVFWEFSISVSCYWIMPSFFYGRKKYIFFRTMKVVCNLLILHCHLCALKTKAARCELPPADLHIPGTNQILPPGTKSVQSTVTLQVFSMGNLICVVSN